MFSRILTETNSLFDKLTDKNFLSRKYANAILIGLISVILIIRLSQLGVPNPDRTDWKEIDFITISQNYISNGFNFSQPTISWPAEPPRVTAMEFPLVPYLAGILFKLFGFNIFSVRIITLLAFILIIWVLYELVYREIGPVPALFAAVMAGFMPLTSRYGNLLFSYPVAILTGLSSVYFFQKWLLQHKTYHVILSCCLFSLTQLLMPTELTVIIPLIWLFYRENRLRVKSWVKMFLFVAASMIVPALWYIHVYFLAKNSIDVFGVFGGHDKYQTLQMMSMRGWYFRLIYNIFILYSGMIQFLIAFAGLCVIVFLKKGRLFLFYGLSFAAFVIVVAEGNYDTPYRQFCGIPVMSALYGIGLTYLLSLILVFKNNFWSKRVWGPVSLVVVVAIISSVAIIAKNYDFMFKRNRYDPIKPYEWTMSKVIEKYSVPGSKIITAGTYTMHKGGNDLSPVLYYYAQRQGWTLNSNQFSMDSLEILRRKGAVLFAIENISREKGLANLAEACKKKYRVIYKDDSSDSILFDIKSD
jgi:hypothetical protein